ncbi:uncharacterized protein LOC131693710 [Topomyia yanbarensis]|uniref:uncharacterized protein LOC131693710 n=1 Tax=Topomyia yanbarensis TaxID=2498891 RepID=UPI00273B0640|nr:uncharacterized protein LOC131693710 [Topomyia yanbarensis]
MEGWNIASFKFNHLPETEIRKEWLRWKRNFDVVAAASDEKNSIKLKNMLLAKGGLELQDLFYSLDGADVVEDRENEIDPYKIAIEKLNEYFSPKQHDSFERSEFCKLMPLTSQDGTREPLAKFLMRCTEQAKKCEFGKTEAESRELRIIDKIVFYAPMELKEKLLQEEELTLTKITKMVNSFESIKHQAQLIMITGNETATKAMISDSTHVNRIQGNTKHLTGTCYRCGQKNHYGNDQQCPARGRKCEKCNKIGHFSKVCRSVLKRKQHGNTSFVPPLKRGRFENVRTIDVTEHNEEQPSFIYNIGDGDEFLWVKIGGVLVQVLIDSGSSKNIIDDTTWEYMQKQGVKTWSPGHMPNTTLRGYARNAKPLTVSKVFVSMVNVEDATRNCELAATFFVVVGGSQTLLGKETAKQLGVLTIGLSSSDTTINVLGPIEKRPFPKMKNVQLRLPVDTSVVPVAQRVRRPPIALLTRIEDKLFQLVATDIIEPVTGAVPWVSPLVTIVKDNGDLRLCVDMRRANQAIQREHHMMPTFEDFLPRLTSSRFFSRLDIKDAFHQVKGFNYYK